jgi:hypothetical protein
MATMHAQKIATNWAKTYRPTVLHLNTQSISPRLTTVRRTVGVLAQAVSFRVITVTLIPISMQSVSIRRPNGLEAVRL